MAKVLLATLFVACGVASARADEEKIDVDKLPKAVLAAAKEKFKDAEITEAAKETEKDKVTYEVTVKVKGKKIDATFEPDGTLTTIEKEMDAKDLPAAVKKAVEDKYPKATYKIAEEVIKVEKKEEKLAYYEALIVTADKKMWELQIEADGTIKLTEDKGTEGKEKDKDKDK